ncbi:MAG: fibronectin type III domain-containing protein [bacterium]
MAVLTRKFPAIIGVLVLLVGIGFGVWYVNSKKTDQNTDVVPNNVKITNTADNKFTVSWTTNIATTGKVKYGKLTDKLTQEAVDERDSLGSSSGGYLTHHINVKDLQPSTAYAFRIESGQSKTLFDNNGSPYSITTGPTIAATPPADTIYGQVQQVSTLPADGAIVYLTMPGAAPVSTLVKSSGAYTIPLSIVRTNDLKAYVNYDPKATIMKIMVEQGKQQANADVSTTNSAPVPMITLGKTHDFRATQTIDPKVDPIVAQIVPLVSSASAAASASASPLATIAPVFNIEALGSASTSAMVTITNPAEEGEKLSSAKPELRGKGSSGTVLSLVVTSTKKTYKDTVAIANNGQWLWAPSTALANGTYTLSLAYIDTKNKEQTVKRSFVIDTTIATQPAFVSTPSASIKPSPSPRVALPATGSGVPVTGVIENTVLTVIFATVIMVGGAMLLVL